MNYYNLSLFDYNLPKELIAQYPIKERGTSRLLVVNRKKEEILVKRFIDLIDFLDAEDVIVLNNTKVLKARLIGKVEKGTKVDALLINKITDKRYEILIKPLKKLKDREVISFNNGSITAEFKKGKDGKNYLEFNRSAECAKIIPTSVGKLSQENFPTFYESGASRETTDFTAPRRFISNGFNLNEIATIPLPPYIKRLPEELDFDRYQTVYAKNEGAIASPTAGLHFTKEILDKLIQKGIKVCNITSNIGYSTFKKVRSEDIREHKLDPEHFVLSDETAEILNETRQNKKRILSVGTSTTRVLESCFENSRIVSKKGFSDLFIYPPFKFNVVDVLLTNFHMPKTTLVMLASAFCTRELLFKAYDIAVKEEFRFLSYGDVMLVL